MLKKCLGALSLTAMLVLFVFPPLAYGYVIHNRMEILKPIDLKAMNTEFQSAALVQDLGATVIVDIDYYPDYTWPALKPNPNWKNDYSKMSEFLNPSLTANWDADFQKQLIADLNTAGINPDQLDDVTLVQKVSKWLLQNKMGPGPFIAYFVDFQNGAPVVKSQFRTAFNEQISQFGITNDTDAFNRSVLGKGIYQNASASSCTPSAILWTTVFRALGIPTRIVVQIPAIDSNDSKQFLAVPSELHNWNILSTVFSGFANIRSNGGFDAHTFNEVFIGGRWARLNYNVIDQPIYDVHYMGLLTQVTRVRDWSEAGQVDTWGLRYAEAQTNQNPQLNPSLTSINPYRSIRLSDTQQSPPVSIAATVAKAWMEGDPSIPSWISIQNRVGHTQVAFSMDMSQPNNGSFGAIRIFSNMTSLKIILTSPDGRSFQADGETLSFYWHVTDPEGLLLDFPVDLRQLFPSGTLLTVRAPTDSPSNYSWLVPPGTTVAVP